MKDNNPEASFTRPTENPFTDDLPDQTQGQRKPRFPADLNRYRSKLTKLIHIPNGMNFCGYVAEIEILDADREGSGKAGDVYAVLFKTKAPYPNIVAMEMAWLRSLVAANAGKKASDMSNAQIFDVLGTLVEMSGDDSLATENDVEFVTCVSPKVAKNGESYPQFSFFPAAA